MSNIYKILLYLAIAVLFLTLSYIGGCSHGRKTKQCPTVVSDTIYRYDTTWVYINQRDTVYLRQDTIIIDTSAILQKFYNRYGYSWEQKDNAIIINGYTTVTQNKILSNELKYKWLLPQQTIINNSVDQSKHYAKYITAGLSVPVKDIGYTSFDLNFVFRRGYVGAFYNHGLQSFGVNAGTVLFKFK